MGSSLSIDKHVTNLDDLLEMPPKYFSRIKFESKVSDNITQHLKVLKLSLSSDTPRFGGFTRTLASTTLYARSLFTWERSLTQTSHSLHMRAI